ncbi:hypothetical protein [Arthrobacter sp. StoSoilB20]|uniref:TY-Chap domain-containing protein n=1 Tax=Arthrobacter sp. StoSoilB20 TaxID=2830995 RepID=UPI001CC74CF7|nr:hypothetical protein [Arthrobacter sp. StoSoilB20]BCW57842.1 hypothetical protein StoSoilB20_11890 [Arthrobacter sp. StoSoilB20]
MMGDDKDSETRAAVIREAYRRGDPLETITSAHSVDAGDIFDAIADKPSDELARARSVGSRAVKSMSALWNNVEMVSRLDDAGIPLLDTPKVIGALGNDIDVDVAVAILKFLGIPDEAPAEPAPKLLSDRLSLLYVVGKHHGIEPDYQLALAKMPLDAVAAFRELVKPEVTYTRLAEILAVAETTALAIHAKSIATLTYSEYDEMAQQISRRLGRVSRDEKDPWPVPIASLVSRYGGGSWQGALDTIRLNVGTPEGRFGTKEHQDALDSFLDECELCGYAMSEESYDLWGFSQAGMLIERPSANEIMRHFGVSWDELIDQVFGSELTEMSATPLQSKFLLRALRDEHAIDADGDGEPIDHDWHRAGVLISDLLAQMPWNSFLRVEYAGTRTNGANPYAQATPSADGVWCEVVSEEFLPATDWPIDREFLASNDWSEPDADFPNWWKSQVSPRDAGHQIVSALRYGRKCVDVTEFRWSTGEFPPGPGPDGGVTLDDALNGAVQTLRNAS